MRILLAEDDHMIGAAVVQALKDASYAVDWVKDGESASKPPASERYDWFFSIWIAGMRYGRQFSSGFARPALPCLSLS